MTQVVLILFFVFLVSCSPKQFESLNRPKSTITDAVTTAPLMFSSDSPIPTDSGSPALLPETPTGPVPQPPLPGPAVPVVAPSLLPATNSRCEQILQCAIANTALNSRRLYYQQLLVNVATTGQGDNTPGCDSLVATVTQQVPVCQR